MENIKRDLKELLEHTDYAIIDFWAPWCGPCLAFAPVFEKMAKKYDKIKFAKCNVDENQEIASDSGVMSIPTIIFYKNGKEMDRMIGAMPEAIFEEKIKSLLSQ